MPHSQIFLLPNLYCLSMQKLALFPGFPAPEWEHWSCAGGESLIFFLMWAVSRVEGGKETVWLYPKTQNRKKSTISGQFYYTYLAIREQIFYTPSVRCIVMTWVMSVSGLNKLGTSLMVCVQARKFQHLQREKNYQSFRTKNANCIARKFDWN